MDNFNNFANQGQVSLENLYPDIYKYIFPIVARVAEDMRRSGYSLTNDILNNSVDNIILMSGLWDEDGDQDPNYDEAFPVQAQVVFGRRPFRRGRRGFHNRNTLRDLTRILLLREFLR